MDEFEVVSSLTALAHETRLRIFRMLIVAGPEGLTPSYMAEELETPASALSFHLKELNRCGLVNVERNGRHMVYNAAVAHMNDLMSYLTAHCCQGQEYVETVKKLACKDC